ncbi:hypothetical protein GE300_18280 [Rhodobacteraceae bacterium 2CG4]|uniref:Uncharacterized protein n=1 Tax=Halovulum marinum TaxID=2662447 RepID=A0A6L5Z631_9RHOB|nr:hypothetical protein [Halovulum marinum]MSU91530.1 hypothetical protein [Halovulum marinum]
MQNTLPLQFDLTKVYSLLQAFDRVGRFTYPDTWTGREAFAAPASEPAEVKAERVRLDDEIASRQVDLERLIHFDGFSLPEGGQTRLAARQFELSEQINQLKDAKDRLQPSYQDREVNPEAFERREALEERLADLFAAGKLRMVTANNNLVKWDQWRSEPDFRIDYAFSMLIAAINLAHPQARGIRLPIGIRRLGKTIRTGCAGGRCR